jgi:hypothetical protein
VLVVGVTTFERERERADPRSLVWGGVFYLVRSMRCCLITCFFASLDMATTSPFIASKERARVTFVVNM